MQRTPIRFTIISGSEKVEVTTFRGEYRNLMVLINEILYVEDFGECKGIGRCGTCLIVFSSDINLPEMDRNEKATLRKANVQGNQWRLSCQIMIDAYLEGSVITIADDREDVR